MAPLTHIGIHSKDVGSSLGHKSTDTPFSTDIMLSTTYNDIGKHKKESSDLTLKKTYKHFI